MAPPDCSRELDHGIAAITTAIERQVPWLLSQGKLKAKGFQFVYSSGPGGSRVVTLEGIPVKMGRCPRSNTPQLHGHFGQAGAFQV